MSAPERPKGSPMLIVLMIIVVLPSVLLGDAWGAGPAGIIGGLTGLFSLVVLMGGPLRADLRIAAVMGPLLVFAAVVPRLVAEVSRPAAIALVVLLAFVAALLPLLGPRFANAGLGLGMTTMFGYGYAPMGGADHQQVIAAAVAGVVVAVSLRLVMGISDPSQPTRQQVAEVLVADDPGSATATAFGTWLSDGRQRWLADALEAASRYRLALHRVERTGEGGPDDAAELRGRAQELAEELRAKTAPEPTAPPLHDSGGGAVALAEAAGALDTVERAVRERDTTTVRLDHDRRHQLKDAVLHPSARLTSIQVRHAFRTALGVLLVLLITLGLERGDPLVSTVLLTTFGTLQASWRETLTRASRKITGLVGGSLTVAVVLLVVPSRYLTAIAAVALCLGLWYIVTRPALGNACMVIVSVGFNSVTRDLDPVGLLAQYVGLTASAVGVGVLLGFAVIPGFRAPPLRARIEAAAAATEAVVRASSDRSRPALTESLTLHRQAAQTQDELVPDREQLDDRQLDELDQLRNGLRELTLLVDAGVAPSTLRELVRQTDSARRYLLGTLPAGT